MSWQFWLALLPCNPNNTCVNIICPFYCLAIASTELFESVENEPIHCNALMRETNFTLGPTSKFCLFVPKTEDKNTIIYDVLKGSLFSFEAISTEHPPPTHPPPPGPWAWWANSKVEKNKNVLCLGTLGWLVNELRMIVLLTPFQLLVAVYTKNLSIRINTCYHFYKENHEKLRIFLLGDSKLCRIFSSHCLFCQRSSFFGRHQPNFWFNNMTAASISSGG